jgi:hypothetical protein
MVLARGAVVVGHRWTVLVLPRGRRDGPRYIENGPSERSWGALAQTMFVT